MSKIKQYTNKILNADSLNIIDKLPLESIDLIISDPPYGQNLSYGIKKIKIKNDNNLKWLFSFAYNAFRILKPNSFCILFWQWRTYIDLVDTMKKAGFSIKTIAIWNKIGPGLGKGITEQYELIIFFRKGHAKCKRFRGNIFSYPKICRNSKHPHQKPIELIKEILNLVSKKRDFVLDPFLGVGSTVIACHETQRNYLGIEVNKKFYEIAKIKLQKLIK